MLLFVDYLLPFIVDMITCSVFARTCIALYI